ncbi:CDP-alcohol phosphatidyltransferase family protein [Sulfurimonas diazotrophicus]|uniref:CDP-alcohol phosphatidyltransferase family protein n=1 Tax=Sulfurimonas diazotrophicus TaxID=3131939 RepID=A0ABZ3HAV9_9BACT
MKTPLWTIPNTLSLFRLACAPLLVLSGLAESAVPFFTILSLMLVSDALDGFLARLLHQTSVLGAKLDSYGDYATYMAVTLGAWLQWPERIEREAPVILLAVAVFILPAVASILKFKRFASYHTWITKLSAILMSLGIFALLVFDLSWPFYVAVAVLMLEAIENIAITLTLDAPETDIHSWWHLRKRR